MECRRKDLVTHFVWLSKLKSISIDDEEGARDERGGEESGDGFSFRGPAILRMLDGLSLEVMIVRRERRSLPGVVLFPR